MTVINGVLIQPPVSMSDVKHVLNNGSPDLGTLCTANQINRWAKYKPIGVPGRGVLTDTQRRNANYGITNIPVWTGNGALNKMGNFWFGVDITPTNYPQCGIKQEYWGYEKPAGGVSSPYRLTDFVKEADSTYGYKHDVEAPIGGYKFSKTKISAVGAISFVFLGNGIGQDDGYTVPLGELSGVGVYTGLFDSLYMSVMIHKKNSNTYYVASRPDQWGVDHSTTVNTYVLSEADGRALNGTCEVFPFLSSKMFENLTHNLSGETGPTVAMFDKSEVEMWIEYAKADIDGFGGYYENESDKFLSYVFSLTNNSVQGGFRAKYTVEFSPQSTFPSTDTVTGEGDIYLAYGSTEFISRSVNLPSQTALHYKNGYSRLIVTAQSGYGIIFYQMTSAAADIVQGRPRA